MATALLLFCFTLVNAFSAVSLSSKKIGELLSFKQLERNNRGLYSACSGFLKGQDEPVFSR